MDVEIVAGSIYEISENKMLINCPECKSEVSDKATSCPKCGFNISTYTPSTKSQKRELTPEEQKIANKGCLIIIVVVLILAAIGALIPDKDKKTSSSSSNNTGLKLQAMQAVRYQLQDYSNANFIMSSVKTTKVGDKYYVIGEFDSINAFGAKVRSAFVVEFIKNSGSSYEATHIEIK